LVLRLHSICWCAFNCIGTRIMTLPSSKLIELETAAFEQRFNPQGNSKLVATDQARFADQPVIAFEVDQCICVFSWCESELTYGGMHIMSWPEGKPCLKETTL
jgi:hypothetical protein